MLATLLHQTIKKVGEDIESLKMNTAISALMILLNKMEEKGVTPQAYKILLQLLAPLAPHIASELWEQAGESTPIYETPWPTYDAHKMASASVTVAVQINGKVRTSIELSSSATKEEALAAARGSAIVAKWLAEGKERQAIYVHGKIINFVVDKV
jgi:leucyl-tRNA synthetase